MGGLLFKSRWCILGDPLAVQMVAHFTCLVDSLYFSFYCSLSGGPVSIYSRVTQHCILAGKQCSGQVLSEDLRRMKIV